MATGYMGKILLIHSSGKGRTEGGEAKLAEGSRG